MLLEAECLDAFHKLQIVYHSSVAASVALAFFSLCVRHVWLRELPGAPSLAFQFYCVIGIMQIVIAIMLITVFVPHCPNSCLDYCSNNYKPAYFVYPIIGTTLGVLLLKEGKVRLSFLAVDHSQYSCCDLILDDSHEAQEDGSECVQARGR